MTLSRSMPFFVCQHSSPLGLLLAFPVAVLRLYRLWMNIGMELTINIAPDGWRPSRLVGVVYCCKVVSRNELVKGDWDPGTWDPDGKVDLQVRA